MNEQWNNALDQVLDEYLMEAVRYRKKRHWPVVVGAAAAVLALAIGWSLLRPEPSTDPKLAAPVRDTTVASDEGSGSTVPTDDRGSSTTLPTVDAGPSCGSPSYIGSPSADTQSSLGQFLEDLWDRILEIFRGKDEQPTPPPTTETLPPTVSYVDDEPNYESVYYYGESYNELRRDCLAAERYWLNSDMRAPFFGDQPPELQFIAVYADDFGGVPWTWYWTSYDPHSSIRVAGGSTNFSDGCSGTEAMYQLCSDAPNLHNRGDYSEYYPQIQEVTVTTADGEKTALMKYSADLDRYFLSFVQNGSLVTVAGDQSILEPEWLASFHLVAVRDLDQVQKQTQEQQANELFSANPWAAAKEYPQYFRVICAKETRYAASGNPYKIFEDAYDAQTNTLISRYYDFTGELQTCTKEEYDQNGNIIRLVEDHGNWGYDTLWEYDGTGSEICETRFDLNGTLKNKSISEYDLYGNRYLYIQYDGDGSKKSVSEYEHDENGNCTKSIHYDSNNVKENTKVYIYDDNGNQLSLCDYDGNGRKCFETQSKYDEDGNLLCYVSYNGDGKSTGKTEYEYDEKGNLIRRSEYEGETLHDHDVRTYDENGNQIQYERHYENSAMDYTYKMKYDENGNKLLQEEYDREGNLVGWIEYEGYQVVCLLDTSGL